nr:WAS/WASL-interacting protein family member 3-like [Dasypus novemcinctus]
MATGRRRRGGKAGDAARGARGAGSVLGGQAPHSPAPTPNRVPPDSGRKSRARTVAAVTPCLLDRARRIWTLDHGTMGPQQVCPVARAHQGWVAFPRSRQVSSRIVLSQRFHLTLICSLLPPLFILPSPLALALASALSAAIRLEDVAALPGPASPDKAKRPGASPPHRVQLKCTPAPPASPAPSSSAAQRTPASPPLGQRGGPRGPLQTPPEAPGTLPAGDRHRRRAGLCFSAPTRGLWTSSAPPPRPQAGGVRWRLPSCCLSGLCAEKAPGEVLPRTKETTQGTAAVTATSGRIRFRKGPQ